jgi:DNA-binding NtrC family response regulator
MTSMTAVLVVEDDPSVRRLLVRWLRIWKDAVKVAITAEEALDAMTTEPAAIVFCDIRLPGRDGLSLAQEIRTRWPRTAIIMASSLDDLRVVEQSRKIGAVDFVSKPFGEEMLRQALARAHDFLAT